MNFGRWIRQPGPPGVPCIPFCLLDKRLLSRWATNPESGQEKQLNMDKELTPGECDEKWAEMETGKGQSPGLKPGRLLVRPLGFLPGGSLPSGYTLPPSAPGHGSPGPSPALAWPSLVLFAGFSSPPLRHLRYPGPVPGPSLPTLPSLRSGVTACSSVVAVHHPFSLTRL